MRVWLVAVLAGLIGFGLARWMGEEVTATGPESGPGTPAGADVKALAGGVDASAGSRLDAQAPAAPQPPPNAPVLTTPPEAPAADGPKLALDAVAFLREWPARLDDLARRAQAGEARALTELAEALDYCTTAGGAVSRARHGASYAGNLADAQVQAYFTEVDGLCKAFLQRNPWLADISRDTRAKYREYLQALRERRVTHETPRPPVSAGDALRRRAADAGDAIAEGLTNDDDVRRACGAVPAGQIQANQQAMWQCIHAAARERLAAIFARRDPREIEAIPRILMAMNVQLLNGSEFVRGNTNIFEENNARWTLTACEFGLDCGPAGRAMRWACANFGACGYRHYRDYAADRLLPPATMRMVDGQVPRLVNLILAGDVDTILGPPPSYRLAWPR